MPSAPQILPTQITQGTAPGVDYRLEGELVPVLHMALDGQVPGLLRAPRAAVEVPELQIGLHPLKKGLKRRVFGGMPLLLLEAQSAGEIAFSRDAPGHIAALHLQPGEGIVVREHQFLAATGGVQYDYSRIKGFANMLYGGGFFVDQFFAGDHEGVVWVHGYGNVFEKALDAGRDDRHRARRLGVPRPLGRDDPGGLRVQDRLARRRRRQPRVQPLHRPRPGRPPERLLPPAGAETGAGGGQQQRRAAAAARRHRRRPARQLGARHDLRARPPRDHPLPPGIVGALGLGGYQLLVDVAGVGAGRLGPQAFLLVAPDPDPSLPDAGTQISLHQTKLRDERETSAFIQLAAQLGYLRLSGYRLALERSGLRSKVNLVNPATGAIAATIPDKHPGRLFGGGSERAPACSRPCALPPAGPPPDTQNPELLRQVLLALALRDESLGGAEAAEVADRALELRAGTGGSIRRRRSRRPSTDRG